MDYYKEQPKLHKLYTELRNDTECLSSNSVESWYEEYVKWMKHENPEYVDLTNSSTYDIPGLCFKIEIQYIVRPLATFYWIK